MSRWLSMLCLTLGTATGLPGCAAYHLRGVVVPGETPGMFALENDDTQLNRPGLDGAVLQLTLDPSAMHPKSLGSVTTDKHGKFDVPIDAIGAGMFEYELEIVCRAAGYKSQLAKMPLPSAKRQLLIRMQPGRDTGPLRPDTMQETLEMSEHLLK